MGESGRVWKEYFDSIEDIMIIVRTNHFIEGINKKGLEVLRAKEDEIVGKKCHQLFHGRDEPCGFCPFEKTFQTKKAETIEPKQMIFDKYYSIKTSPIFNEEGELVKFVGFLRDITQQRAVEIKNHFLAAIVESSNDAIIGKSLNGEINSWNMGAQEIYGYTEKEIIGQNISCLIPEDRNLEITHILEKIAQGERINQFDTLRKTKQGCPIDVSLTISPIKDKNNRIVGASTIARDITKNKQIEKEKNHLIHSLNERVKELDCLYGISKLVDVHGNKLDEIFRETVDLIPLSWQYPEVTCDRIVFDEKTFASSNFEETPWNLTADIIISGEKKGFIQVCYLTEKPEAWEGCFLEEERNLINGIARQVSLIADRALRENEMKRALKEKETLLKEIHHRVKNNLQIISSLLKLQSNSIDDDDYLEKIKVSHNRIQSIARVHEQLYNSENLAEINVDDYIKNLIQDILQSYDSNSGAIDWGCDCHDLTLNLNKAIPFALIINELISNAYKHAFSDQENGKINIELIMGKNNQYTLTVMDDGKGLPDNFNLHTISSLGLQLVHNLVKQLKGTITWYNDKGAVFEINFEK